jgi:hypothetical protein
MKLSEPYFESNAISLFSQSNGLNFGNSWFFTPMLQMHINKESRIFLAQNPINVRNLSVFTENINHPILSDSPEKKSCKLHPMLQNPLRHLIES